MILSLCIPTYNRADDLKNSLKRINAQLIRLDECMVHMIEVRVLDNFSSDNTELICKKFSSESRSKFSYQKNPKNIGFDGSIAKLYSDSEGEYVWFISDDDEIIEGKIKCILDILKLHKPDLCYANVAVEGQQPRAINNQITNLTHFPRSNCSVKLTTDSLIYFANNLERLAHIRLCSFISACVIKKDVKIISRLPNFIGTGLMQDAIMNLSLRIGSSAYLPSNPIVISGSKDYVSEWFVHSVLFGALHLYSSNSLENRDCLNRIISIDSCRFGLMVLANRRRKNVMYPVNIKLLYKLIQEHGIYTACMLKELFLAFFPWLYEFYKTNRTHIRGYK